MYFNFLTASAIFWVSTIYALVEKEKKIIFN